jgi:hypothetical protein
MARSMSGCIGNPCAFFVTATRIGDGIGSPIHGAGTHQGSRGSRRAMTSVASRTSRTSRAIAPCTDINCASIARSLVADGFHAGTRPGVGLTVATPQQNAGYRSEPPMSLP